MASDWKRNYTNYRSFLVSGFGKYKQRSDIKAYLELLLSLASIIVFSVFALRPTLTAIAKLYQEINTNEETLSKLDSKISDLRKVQDLYETEKDKITILNNALPQNPLPDSLARQFEGIAEKTNTTVTSLTLSKIPLLPIEVPGEKQINDYPKGVNSFNFGVSATSSYPTLFDFLSEVENLRTPVTITSVNVQPQQSSTGTFVNLNIGGSIPYIPDGTQISFSKR
jgi:hypothetical protein